MSNVIPLHSTAPAKAAGVFAQINIAARRMGYPPELAAGAAQTAKRRYQQGGASAARVVSDMRASLRRDVEQISA